MYPGKTSRNGWVAVLKVETRLMFYLGGGMLEVLSKTPLNYERKERPLYISLFSETKPPRQNPLYISCS